MIIRKLFKFCGSHRVVDCSTKRCSRTVHGHNYIVEVFLTSDGLDRAGMVVDFSILKNEINDFIDSFDHSCSIWSKEPANRKRELKKLSDRWVDMPVTPSAESYGLLFFYVIDKIIKNTIFANGEKNPRLHSIRVHETDTGYAEVFADDMQYVNFKLQDIVFSDAIKLEWKNKNCVGNWFDDLISNSAFKLQEPEYQIYPGTCESDL